MSQSEAEKRFFTLETKVAYQEKLLADLNDVLATRGREIDSLEKRVRQLEKQVADAGGDPADEAPPHY